MGEDSLAVDVPSPARGQRRVPAGRDALLTVMTPVFPDNATLALLHNQARLRPLGCPSACSCAPFLWLFPLFLSGHRSPASSAADRGAMLEMRWQRQESCKGVADFKLCSLTD